MKMHTLHDMWVEQLRDLYSAENQLIKALPKMAKAASSDELRRAIEEHLEQTKGQAERLEQIFQELDLKPKGKKCVAMEGLIEEGKEVLEEEAEPAVIDAGIIGAAQKVEHYEMAGYGTVRTWAMHLGQNRAADLLQHTLDEEGEADHKLTEIAERIVNQEAVQSQ
jgi:ferritin-like metal-binding protein YciE